MNVLCIILVPIAFFVSATVGMGGSLILIPLLSILYGPKYGVMMATVLLTANNITKLVAYRNTLPWIVAAKTLALTILGAFLGAKIFTQTPEVWIGIGGMGIIALSFLAERFNTSMVMKKSGLIYALIAGLCSGFTGMSGPFKGLALKNLTDNRTHFTGGATLISLAVDLTKFLVYATTPEFWPIQDDGIFMLILIAPVMTCLGFRLNQKVNEKVFSYFFWLIMTGYSLRIIFLNVI